MTSATTSAFSDREFRDVLGLFATGVTVVTGISSDGIRLGATISSFSSVSLDPPLVLFSLSRRATAFKAWSGVENFAINILAEDQSAISTRFAVRCPTNGMASRLNAGQAAARFCKKHWRQSNARPTKSMTAVTT